ncbi:hypothetical protein Tco_0214063 [Tanacetum coccineum]
MEDLPCGLADATEVKEKRLYVSTVLSHPQWMDKVTQIFRTLEYIIRALLSILVVLSFEHRCAFRMNLSSAGNVKSPERERSSKRAMLDYRRKTLDFERAPEFTWEREDYMKSKYPQLFVDRADESAN